MNNYKDLMIRYAKLIIDVGVHLQTGQSLTISAPLHASQFVHLLTKHAYSVGASTVYVDWYDDELFSINLNMSPLESLGKYPAWKARGWDEMAEENWAFLMLSSPGAPIEIDINRQSTYSRAKSEALKKWRSYTFGNKVSWCVAPLPSEYWAKRVFPLIFDADLRMTALWEVIYSVTRIDTSDPVKSWEEHRAIMNKKLDFMNKSQFKALHFTSKDTDLMVELPENHKWVGGASKNQTSGHYFYPNLPTEEIYTAPKRNGVSGVVRSTRPLVYGGVEIVDFRLVFKEGRVREYEAGEYTSILGELIHFDDGASFLGEVALVPHNSPISLQNLLFYNTLLDENSSCHLALGRAYPLCLNERANLTPEELLDRGLNISGMHLDFMIGSPDMDIEGVSIHGERVSLFQKGNWVE